MQDFGKHAQGAPSVVGRVPPHNLEAERSVLGAVLVSNESFHRLAEVGIESRDFYKEAHEKTFEAIQSLGERGQPIDMVTLTSFLRDRGIFEEVGGTTFLMSLFEDHFAYGNIEHYARIVREKAILRRMIDVAGDISGKAFDGVESLEDYLDEAESKVFAVSDSKSNRNVMTMQQIVLKNIEKIDELAQNKEMVIGLPTGFTEYDRLTNGMQSGQLIIVAGRPAMGKTSLVLSMAQYAALKNDAVIAIFSLEMSSEELGLRFISGLTKIDSKKLKTGRLNEREFARLTESADKLANMRITVADDGNISVLDIRSICRRIHAREKRLDLIVVDYLQLLRGMRSGQNIDRVREVSEISRSLKALSKELRVPIVALSQLSRQVESRPDKRPMLSDLRESGAIEQDADIVAFVYRDEVYNKETEDRGIAELIIAKHRAGETGTVRLAWLAEYTLFANLANDHQPMGSGGGNPPVIYPRGDRDDVSL